jgi:hypothetical protein
MTSASGPGRPELIDLSHTVHDGLVTYPFALRDPAG